MYDSFADSLVRVRCRQEPAGLTPGRPDEGVWAYASDANRSLIFSLEEGMGSTYN